MNLLDSTIVIDFLRGRPAAVSLVERLVDGGTWHGASELTRFEILAGTRSAEEDAVERLFLELGWVPVEEGIARHAGALARRYRRAHPGIDDVDFVIAATALELDADLLTTNVRHFPMLAGLEAAY